MGPQTQPKVVHYNGLWKYRRENPPSQLTITDKEGLCSPPIVVLEGSESESTESLHNKTASDYASPLVPRRSTCKRKEPGRFVSGIECWSPKTGNP